MALPPLVPHFGVPTVCLVVALRQTLGGRHDFSSEISHPRLSCVVTVPRQALRVLILLLPGILTQHNIIVPDLTTPVAMAAHSTVPLGGPSTPRHPTSVNAGAFYRELVQNWPCHGSGVHLPWWGGSTLNRLWAKHPLAEPEPEQNLFLALPYLPGILPFF